MLDVLVPGGKAAECYEARHDYRDAFLPCFHRRDPRLSSLCSRRSPVFPAE